MRNLILYKGGGGIILFLLLPVPSSSLHAFLCDALVPAVIDVRSVGMGNTAAVSSTGSNAIFYNPALLGDGKDVELQIGTRFYFGTGNQETSIDEDFSSTYSSPLNFTHISLTLPIQMDEVGMLKLIPAFGYHLHLDLSTINEVHWSYPLGGFDVERRAKGGFGTLTPACALQLDNKYSVGLAYNFGGVAGIDEYYHETLVFDARDDESFEGDYAYEYWDCEIRSEYSSHGDYVLVGAFLEPVPQIGIAFSYRSPLSWGWRWGEEDVRITWIILTTQYGYDTLTFHDEYSYDNDEAFELPGVFSLGIRSKILPALTLAAEYQSRRFSDLRIIGDQLNVDNGSAFRFGAEWADPVFIRAGFYTEAIPRTDEGTDRPKHLTGVTAGLGIPITSFVVVNGSFEYASWNQTVTSEGEEYSEDLFRTGFSLKLRIPG